MFNENFYFQGAILTVTRILFSLKAVHMFILLVIKRNMEPVSYEVPFGCVIYFKSFLTYFFGTIKL
jgi:hypothetical protein